VKEDLAVPTTAVTQAMPPSGPPSYPAALWVGAVDEADVASGRLRLVDAVGYGQARLLVRSGRSPRGFVELPVVDGSIDQGMARAAVDQLPPAAPRRTGTRSPISVVLCTYDRPAVLASAVRSVQALDYPDFEIVVVDTPPASELAAATLRSIDDPRIRLVEEPSRGVARARNTGLLAARHDVVAFTDDDVVVDPSWLQGIDDGFAAAPDVACVTGIVPGGEITTESQDYFDRRVAWARSCQPEVFSLPSVLRSEPLFPFALGTFGTGANFAVRRDVVVALGGFDEALGAGSPCGGCEDLDMFVRVLLAGHHLVYEPAALAWHRHRADLESLTEQMADYGLGLGALYAKLATNPRTLSMMARRLVPALRQLRSVTNPEMQELQQSVSPHESLWRLERRAVLDGPLAFARARRTGARSRPLSPAR